MADQIVLPLTSQMASTEPPIPWHQPFRHQDGPFSVLFFFSSSPTGRGELDRKFLLTFTLNCSVSIFLTPISIFFSKLTVRQMGSFSVLFLVKQDQVTQFDKWEYCVWHLI